MIIKCTTHKSLMVYDVGVKFVDGQADVKDKAKIDALKALDAKGVYGFTGFVSEAPVSKPKEKVKGENK